MPDEISDQLRAMIEEVLRLTRPSDMSRRIELLKAALSEIPRVEIPELWATLQVEPANSYYYNLLGDQALPASIGGTHQGCVPLSTIRRFDLHMACTAPHLASTF